MAGKIVADTLEHSTAGSIATNYVVEGSAKAWVNFNGTGTLAVRNSLNTSSVTDNSTGNYSQAYTNSFSAADYSICATVSDNSGVNAQWTYDSASTSGFTYYTADDAGSGYTWTDYASNSATINGDLA